jgi:hypothetical protein
VISCIVAAWMLGQEPEVDLATLHRACLIVTQPMAYAVREDCVLDMPIDQAKSLGVELGSLLTGDGKLAFFKSEDALLAFKCHPRRARWLPLVRSAYPWLYESESYESGGPVVAERFTDGRVLVAKVRHSHKSQCTVSYAADESGFSVNYLALPIPGRTFLEFWFKEWTWKASQSKDVREPSWVASRQGVGCVFYVWTGVGGLPFACARVADNREAGEVSYYHFSGGRDNVLWLSRIVRFVWNAARVQAYDVRVENPVPITSNEVQRHPISIAPGDIFCDVRSRPYRLIEVESGSVSAIQAPHVVVIK